MRTFAEGDSFGDYRVVRQLGKGGMGAVWLLRSPSGAEVAAKILDEESSSDHRARKRFLQEAELAIGLRHPNLVATYDVGEDPDTGLCYILMEYVPGGTLADRIKSQGPMRIAEAVEIVKSIAAVLEFGRRHGIVHRDIKPANIMFSADGTPKLADLGIARANKGGSDTTTMTQTGVMIGTPAYMSPEQMMDSHHVDTRADIYSLGIVFYEMLAGERPNKDDTVIQLMAKAVKGEPLPDVRILRPEVSAALAQLLNMMVAPDRNARIPTPGQVASAIDAIKSTGRFSAQSPAAQAAAAPQAPAAKPDAAPTDDAKKKSSPWNIPLLFGVMVGIAAIVAIVAPSQKKTVDAFPGEPGAGTGSRAVADVTGGEPAAYESDSPAAGPQRPAKADASPEPAAATTPRPQTPPAAAEAVATKPAAAAGFEARKKHRGAKPAPGWLATAQNGTVDIRMSVESSLSGNGRVDRAICMFYPQSNQYQDIRWRKEVPPELVKNMPETGDKYIRLADNGRHLVDIDEAFEFTVACKSAKVDFSKVDGTVPYDKNSFLYKTFTRDWREDDPKRVLISTTHPWIVKNRDEILSAVGNDHADYAHRAYTLVTKEFQLRNFGGDIAETIQRKGGNGAAVPAVFVSLLRAAGIPARILCGKNAAGRIRLFPEFYLEGCGWIPTDIFADIAPGGGDGHFGVYDAQCAIYASDIDVSVRGVKDDICHFENFFMAWWWIVDGNWTPCDTRFGWSAGFADGDGKEAQEESGRLGRSRQAASGRAAQTAVFPTLDRSPKAWAYSFDEERNWNRPEFDDSHWKRAPGGFGRREEVKQLHNARMNTDWSTKRIFLRKRFTWDGGKVSRAVVDVYHDDDTTIWLNGRLMLTLNDPNFGWQPFEIPAKRFARALRKGENVFCVEVRNRRHCQYFDCGLVVECGGVPAKHAGPDGLRKVRAEAGTWTVVVEDGVAQIGDGRNVALEPRPKGKLKIPAELDGLEIRRIARDSFLDCVELESVEIPEGVFSVGRGAFCGCSRLKNVQVPDTLEHFGIESLQFTALHGIDLRNVRLLEEGVFNLCNKMSYAKVAEGNARYAVKDGVLYDKARRAVAFCPRSRKNYTVPSGIEEIYAGAFQGSAIKRIVLPETVEFVGYSAFRDCIALDSVKFFGEDAIILGGAFANTPSLKSLVLPSRLKYLDDWGIFAGASRLEAVTLPSTLEVIDDAVFENCRGLKRIELGKSLKKVDHHAFSQCVRLKSVSFPATLKELGAEVFLGCAELKTVSFAGDAPALVDQGNPIGGDGRFGHDLYREANPSLVTLAARTSTGWQADAPGKLPKKWPEGAGESARAIRYGR